MERLTQHDVPERTLPPEPRCVAICHCCGNDIFEGDTYHKPQFWFSCVSPEQRQRKNLPGWGALTITVCEQCMEDSKYTE